MTFAGAVKRQLPNCEIKDRDDEKKVDGEIYSLRGWVAKGISRKGSRSTKCLFGWFAVVFKQKRAKRVICFVRGGSWRRIERLGMESGTNTGESKGLLGNHLEPGDISKYNSAVTNPFVMDCDSP